MEGLWNQPRRALKIHATRASEEIPVISCFFVPLQVGRWLAARPAASLGCRQVRAW